MKATKHLFVLLVLFILLLSPVFAGGEEAKAEYFDVSKRVVMAKHEYGANMTCIAGEEGLYFIDTGMKTELAAKFRKDMEKVFKKKTKALLLTHAHIDHFLGMAAFSDVEVVAAETGKPLWQRQLAIEFNEKAIEAYTKIFPKFGESIGTAKPFMPTKWFKDEIVLGEGKNRIIFTNTGGHSADSSSVYFPRDRVLVAGDLIQVDQYPYFGDPTTDMDKWLTTFDRWLSMEITAVCAGHGRGADKSYIKLMKDYFVELIAIVKKLKAEGLTVDKVYRNPALPKKYWPEDKPEPRWWGYAVSTLYKKL